MQISERSQTSARSIRSYLKIGDNDRNHVKEIDGMLPIKNPAYDPKAESMLGVTRDFPIHKYPSY